MFDPYKEFANHLLANWQPISAALTPEDEAHIYRTVREAQLAVAREENRQLKAAIVEEALAR